jgi:hypothetical protein
VRRHASPRRRRRNTIIAKTSRACPDRGKDKRVVWWNEKMTPERLARKNDLWNKENIPSPNETNMPANSSTATTQITTEVLAL